MAALEASLSAVKDDEGGEDGTGKKKKAAKKSGREKAGAKS
jgi:hypothetical protein